MMLARNPKFADSPLEETVRSELVSEMGCRVRQKLTRIPASLWMITEGYGYGFVLVSAGKEF